MNNRKTITLNKSFLNIASVLPKETRLEFYDRVFKHFLDGQDLDLKEAPELLKVALVAIMPELRKLQARYDAGTTEKKFTEKTKATLCPSDRSKTKQNEANQSGNDNNIYSTLPKLIYILYKYSSPINQYDCVHTHEKTFKQDRSATTEARLNKLQSENPVMYKYFNQIVTKVNSGEEIKISGVPTTAEKILPQLAKIAEQSNLDVLLKSIYEESANPKVRDRIKYSISSLYNLATRLSSVPPTRQEQKADFTQRSYSEEELNQIFDSLDDIEIENLG